MPTIQINQDTSDHPDVVFLKLQKYCDEKLVIKEVGGIKPNIVWTCEKRTGQFLEKGIRGTITVHDSSPCRISVEMDLPLLLSPIKYLFKKAIQEHLAKLL